MPATSLTSLGEGLVMSVLSQIVKKDASPLIHNLCGEKHFAQCDFAFVETEKNGGPNYLRAWREYRHLTQEKLAELVGTNANMIGYLENGDRGLSAKWLRRLAPALDTTPGLILDHDPHTLDSDILAIWASGNNRQKRQLSEIAKALVRTGTEN